MRYLAYTLLFINAVFFFFYSADKTPQQTLSALDDALLDVDHLILLSERTQQPIDVEQLTEVNPNMESVSAAFSPYQVDCYAVGPLSQGKVDSIYEKLVRHEYRASIRTSNVEESAGYRVFLPAMSLEDARRTIEDLEVRGMNDYFMGKQNDISLGIFSSRSKAQVQQQKVEQYGYRVEIENRYRIRVAYWLDVEEDELPLMQSDIWTEIQSTYPEVKSSLVSCE